MIRNPIHSTLGRGRPELTRLSEGIAASLRQFSIAQARCDDKPSRPSGRQRSAAAASELVAMNEDRKPARGAAPQAARASASRPAAATRAPEMPKVITIANLRGGGLRGGIQGRFAGPNKAQGPGGSAASSGAVIRGGFRGRGRGGAFRGGAAGGRGGAVGGRGGAGGYRGGAGGYRGGRGRGLRRGRGDDRPMRGPRRTQEEKEDDQEYQRFKNMGEEDPEVSAYVEKVECGVVHTYTPMAPKELLADLAAYSPAVASSAPISQTATTLFQARMLGGGKPYHPDEYTHPRDAKKLYTEGEGIFFPSPEAKAWTEKAGNFNFKAPPQETTSAVLNVALQGKYEGPKFAPSTDAFGTIQSYVKRDGTWNMVAERGIEAKVRSLLVAAPKGGAPKPKGKKA
ncbi:uncharacterized protein JN550_003914 [Neoarthrinium moseri]|uniref:uncharacterized protein n=1 Tax=Neoarthrinium moseri TaxID=1658444 RepID=UPI001FDB1F5C|nr:uncharacterized protein JN550_003914 [Neoarthrinium moseri]KAI1872195.1 hypothetical protein JN550_003914 [Neoarthrinium moseri]